LTHPGELIAEYLENMSMSQRELAMRTGLTPKHICEVIKGRSRLSLDMALRLEYVLKRPAHFWTNLQQRWDLEKARAKI
jgi:HTH-type transcriptional regulator / antitoxin HigA